MTHSRVTKYNAIHIRGTWGQKGHQQKTQHYALLKKSVEKYIYIKIIIHWWVLCIFTAVYYFTISLVEITVNNNLSEKYFLRVHGMTEGNHHSKRIGLWTHPFSGLYAKGLLYIHIHTVHKQGFEQMQLFNVTIFCGVLTSNPVIYGTCIYVTLYFPDYVGLTLFIKTYSTYQLLWVGRSGRGWATGHSQPYKNSVLNPAETWGLPKTPSIGWNSVSASIMTFL